MAKILIKITIMVKVNFTMEYFPDIRLFPGFPGVFQAFVAAGIIMILLRLLLWLRLLILLRLLLWLQLLLPPLSLIALQVLKRLKSLLVLLAIYSTRRVASRAAS